MEILPLKMLFFLHVVYQYVPFFLSYKSRKIYFFVIGIVFVLLNIICLESVFILGTQFTYEFAMSLLLSNVEEVKEFVLSMVSCKMFLVLFGCFVPMLFIKFLPYRTHFNMLRYFYSVSFFYYVYGWKFWI